jgi:hypothetical protein
MGEHKDNELEIAAKWAWCMDYCKRNSLAPAKAKNWQEALEKYEKLLGVGCE